MLVIEAFAMRRDSLIMFSGGRGFDNHNPTGVRSLHAGGVLW